MATYGEGDPTDNAQQLYEFINTTDTDFKGVKYAVSFRSWRFLIVFDLNLKSSLAYKGVKMY